MSFVNILRKLKWDTDTQFNYQQPYSSAPVFTNTEINGSGSAAKLQLQKKANNNDDILYDDVANFTPNDPTKITIADSVAKLKSGIGVDVNYPMTDPANYDISDANEIQISGGYGKLYLPDLYAFWKFNESTGSDVSDSSGNSRSGTLYNMADSDWQAGKLNNAIHYNVGGSSNEYSLFGNIAAFERDETFSYEWWIKGTSSATRILFSKTPYGAWQGLEVFLISGKVSIYLIGSSEQIYKQGSVPANTGSWVHCAITYSGNSDHSGIKIYIDGVECGVSGSGSLTTSIVNTNDFQISGRGGIANFVIDDCMIDNFRIFSKELSQAEIDTLYNSGSGTESLGYPTDYPYINNKTGLAFTAALTSFIETATKNNGTEIKYQISDDDGITKYYWTGVAWAVSDGTYAQASLASDIHANLATWSSNGTLKWYALLDSNGGVDTPLLDNIYVQSPSNYPTDDDLYIDTKDVSQIAPSDLFAWLSTTVTHSNPANTYIAVLVSVDGRTTWLRWNGSGWVTASSPTSRSDGISVSVFETNFANLPVGDGTLDIRLFLKTDDLTITPSVTGINVISDAGYYATGSYVSTAYYPTGYFTGLSIQEVTFTAVSPSGTTLTVYAKFFPVDTIDEKDSNYVEYESGDNIDFTDAQSITWKVEMTSTGENTPYLDVIEFSFYTLLGLAEIAEVIAEGRWRIADDDKQIIFYKRDKTAPFLTFNLKDKDGNLTTRNIFERLPI